MADGRELLKKFSGSDLVQMRERRYEWYGVPVEATPDAEPVRHPILEECGDDVVMRYSSKYVQRVEDGLMPRYIDLGQEFFRSQHMAIPAEDGDILLWDNWRMIHARNSFSDPDRHLRRMLLARSPAVA